MLSRIPWDYYENVVSAFFLVTDVIVTFLKRDSLIVVTWSAWKNVIVYFRWHEIIKQQPSCGSTRQGFTKGLFLKNIHDNWSWLPVLSCASRWARVHGQVDAAPQGPPPGSHQSCASAHWQQSDSRILSSSARSPHSLLIKLFLNSFVTFGSIAEYQCQGYGQTRKKVLVLKDFKNKLF